MEVKKVRRIQSAIQIPGFIVITLLGIAFMVLSILAGTQKIPESFVLTDASIVRIDRIETGTDDNEEYRVFMRYDYGEYHSEEAEYPHYDSSMKTGDHVSIYVDPADPSVYQVEQKMTFLPILFSGVFILIGIIGIVYYAKKFSKNKGGNQQ